MPKRKIIVKNRVSVYSLRPEEIHGVKVIKITHKLNAYFYNPSSEREPLFWEHTICGGGRSYIDIPESLKRISPIIDAEDIYSFKELLIDGEPVPFKKNIRHMNSNQIGMHVTYDRFLEPKRTRHVCTLDEGLYEYNDSLGEEMRSQIERLVIVIEKPENLRVNVNVYGENATLNVLLDSSRVYCVEILGLTSKNGFSIKWSKVGTLQLVSQKIPFARTRILACVTFAFLVALTAVVIAQKNIMLLPIVPFNIIVGFLALIFAFSPQHAREIINALKEIYQALTK